ncbi:MAG: superoxide dismutase family protein [Rhizobiales bacterium]|nr:superoxide dismutase family protein [Hyphomicrobiales bacterium]OJY03793.1 MAG: superoxide dismutase [Rhizobiales bacterium 63-22]
MTDKFLPIIPAVLIAALAVSQADAAGAAETAHGKLVGADGSAIGSIVVTEAPRGVILRVEASGLKPGWHGIHFHEMGDCSGAGFKKAGGHVHTVTPVVHGFLNAKQNDDGDLPNIHADKDGKAAAEFYSDKVALNKGSSRPALLGKHGASVVIHANPDDYSTQPIGGAGDRVACAVIER